ncbi:MAG: dihydroorotase, partial [Bacteroidetes bacterium]
LQYLGITGRPLVHTPHDPSIAGDAQMNESEQSAMLGMKGEPELSELLPVVKALEVLRYTSGSLHIQPISSPMALQRIHAVKADLPGLSTGVCLYNFALDDTALSEFDSNLKVFPPLRSPAQRTQLTDLLRQGAIDVLCSGHQAQGIEEKQVEFGHADPGMLGLQTAFSLAVMHLIDTEALSLAQWVEKTAISPAKILGTEAPVIAEGHLATLTLFDPEKTWTLTREDIPSRAKNSPFTGQLLKGKALGIVQKGRLYTN